MNITFLIGIIIFLIIGYLFHKNNVNFVRNNSICLQKIYELNLKQDFKIFKSTETYYKNCNSKTQFDNFKQDNFVMAIIDENLDKYIGMIKDLKHNWTNFKSYQAKFDNILNGNYDYKQLVQNSFLNEYFFKKLEIIECEKEKLRPPMQFVMQIVVSYRSPQGRNCYNKTYQIQSNNVEYYCNECIKKRKYKQSAQYQRSLMTDKLRYQVLNRDHHRCVICGASANDGVKLHVDHIIPVSKGGKTELSNLRTLCERCNLGKGASYNPNGYN